MAAWLPGIGLGFRASMAELATCALASLAAVLAGLHAGLGRRQWLGLAATLASLWLLASAGTPGAAALGLEASLVASGLLAAMLGPRRVAAVYFAFMQLGGGLAIAGLLAGPRGGGLVAAGALFKLGVFPLHLGLVAAYSGLAPAAAAVLAASTAMTGPLLLEKALLLGASYPAWLMVLGSLAALTSALAASVEDRLQQMAAYTASAHGGLAVAAAAAPGQGPLACLMLGAAAAVTEGLLFSVLDVIRSTVGVLDRRRLGMLASAMPLSAAAGFAALLGAAGAPPFPGFVGETLAVASLASVPLAALLAAAAVLVATGYSVATWVQVFWHPRHMRPQRVPPEPLSAGLTPLMLLTLLSIASTIILVVIAAG